MGIQDDAARSLADALGRRHLSTRMAQAMEPSVWITEHPEAVVYFTVDGLGALVTKLVVEGRKPVYPSFLPTAAGADALAEYLVEQIGDGGRAGG